MIAFCVGAATLDELILVDEFASSGGPASVVISRTLQVGGPGLNCAAHLAHMGHEVELVTVVGDDDAGRMILEGVDSRGIGRRMVQVESGGTSRRVMVIVRNSDGEKRFYYTPDHVSPLDASVELRAKLSAADLLLFDEANGATLSLAADCRRSGRLAACNIGWVTEGLEMLVQECRVVVTSWAFAESWLSVGDPCDAAVALWSPGRVVAVTDGANGAFVHSDEGPLRIPADSAAIMDTTGAGDAFASAFAAALTSSSDVSRAARCAARVAARACESRGGSGPFTYPPATWNGD